MEDNSAFQQMKEQICLYLPEICEAFESATDWPATIHTLVLLYWLFHFFLYFARPFFARHRIPLADYPRHLRRPIRHWRRQVLETLDGVEQEEGSSDDAEEDQHQEEVRAMEANGGDLKTLEAEGDVLEKFSGSSEENENETFGEVDQQKTETTEELKKETPENQPQDDSTTEMTEEEKKILEELDEILENYKNKDDNENVTLGGGQIDEQQTEASVEVEKADTEQMEKDQQKISGELKKGDKKIKKSVRWAEDVEEDTKKTSANELEKTAEVLDTEEKTFGASTKEEDNQDTPGKSTAAAEKKPAAEELEESSYPEGDKKVISGGVKKDGQEQKTLEEQDQGLEEASGAAAVEDEQKKVPVELGKEAWEYSEDEISEMIQSYLRSAQNEEEQVEMYWEIETEL